MQGRKSAQHREGMRRRRPFAIAKRGPTTGVSGKMRKSLAEQVVSSQVTVKFTNKLSVRTSVYWARTMEHRTWDTFAKRIDTPHLSHLAQAHNCQQLLQKKRKLLASFFAGLRRLTRLADGPGWRPGRRAAVAAALAIGLALIAQ